VCGLKTKDARCIQEIKARIIRAKAALKGRLFSPANLA
jgi:hypothetical protein